MLDHPSCRVSHIGVRRCSSPASRAQMQKSSRCGCTSVACPSHANRRSIVSFSGRTDAATVAAMVAGRLSSSTCVCLQLLQGSCKLLVLRLQSCDGLCWHLGNDSSDALTYWCGASDSRIHHTPLSGSCHAVRFWIPARASQPGPLPCLCDVHAQCSHAVFTPPLRRTKARVVMLNTEGLAQRHTNRTTFRTPSGCCMALARQIEKCGFPVMGISSRKNTEHKLHQSVSSV